jgi:hypothetical protein
MKKTLKTPALLVVLLSCLALSCVLFTGCDDHPDVCVKCSATYAKERKVKQITYYDSEGSLKEKYRFYYTNFLVDSITKVSYGGASAKIAATDSVITRLKVLYASGECIPSAYTAKTYIPANPVSVEKAFFSISGDEITNKHLAFYPDEDFLAVDKTADIDYSYDGSGRVSIRNGTDYGILVWPNLYGNENYYTFTGNNITHIVAQKEQAGYNLDNIFDARNSPFNIQGGVLYYLNLISYPDQEYFETLALDRNNATKMVYKGTDTSNSHVTITFTLTYSYDGLNYPAKVKIHEAKDDDIYGDSETNHGTYLFAYY